MMNASLTLDQAETTALLLGWYWASRPEASLADTWWGLRRGSMEIYTRSNFRYATLTAQADMARTSETPPPILRKGVLAKWLALYGRGEL